jgi:hypothetical protein
MNDTIEELPQPDPPLQEAPRQLRFRNSVPDWGVRGFLFVVFLYFGTAKFKSDPGAPWVVLFDQVGLGQWLRYFAASVECLAAFLVLISASVEVGLAILIMMMFSATIVTIFVLRQISQVFVPFALLCGMIAFWLHRRRV